MEAFARAQVGKPFNKAGLYRSITPWSRACTDQEFFCSELMCRILQQGGLLLDWEAGAMTPALLNTQLAHHLSVDGNPIAIAAMRRLSGVRQHQQQQQQQHGVGCGSALAEYSHYDNYDHDYDDYDYDDRRPILATVSQKRRPRIVVMAGNLPEQQRRPVETRPKMKLRILN